MSHPFQIPGAPAELMALINARRSTIPPGLMMMADSTDATSVEQEGGTDGSKGAMPGDDQDSSLNEGGRKALQVEREARKQLEKEVAELKNAKATLDQLAAVFTKDGEKPDPNADLAAQVTEMRKQLEEAAADKERDQLAQKVATESDITDLGDLALIRAQADETAMRALAKRLKGAGAPNLTHRTPRPDPSQGSGGQAGGRPSSVAEAKKARLDQLKK